MDSVVRSETLDSLNEGQPHASAGLGPEATGSRTSIGNPDFRRPQIEWTTSFEELGPVS
jgi:hypothetical protein